MMSLAILAVSAVLIALLITPGCRALCRRLEWFDRPGPRKLHRGLVPRTGGIAIFFAYAGTLALLRFTPLGKSCPLAGAAPHSGAVLPALLVVFVTGLVDDLFNLKPWMKVAGQVLAALLLCAAGMEIRGAGSLSVGWAWWHAPITVFWLVGCANAFNLIDGLDGLAAGVGLFAAAGALLSALLHGNAELAVLTAPLLGALLGFLPFNFSPASIFMGDCGSNTVGFLLGYMAIVWSRQSSTLPGMAAPLVALAIPLFDTALTITRRFLAGQRLFVGDRRHIHHRLLARGFTPRRVACLLYTAAGLLACLAIFFGAGACSGWLVPVALGVLAWLAVRYLGYEEFDSVRQAVFGGWIRDALNADLSGRQLEPAIRPWALQFQEARPRPRISRGIHEPDCSPRA